MRQEAVEGMIETGKSWPRLWEIAGDKEQAESALAAVKAERDALLEQIKVGDEVLITQNSAPDKPVKGRIARTAGAIDTTTRSLQVDIEVPNEGRVLMPGAYIEATLKIATGKQLIIPTNSLIFGAGGPFVATVKDNKIVKKKVSLGIDYGLQVEVRSGLTSDEDIVLNPLDSIADGQVVKVETPSKRP
jgi:RND family efflux transporter MFP subunit